MHPCFFPQCCQKRAWLVVLKVPYLLNGAMDFFKNLTQHAGRPKSTNLDSSYVGPRERPENRVFLQLIDFLATFQASARVIESLSYSPGHAESNAKNRIKFGLPVIEIWFFEKKTLQPLTVVQYNFLNRFCSTFAPQSSLRHNLKKFSIGS